MFAINHYNEGVHDHDIDGVILGRGTASDIVYFEQIGRALSVRGNTYEEFNKSLAIGVTAPFYLSKLFAPYFTKDGCIINISSTRDNMSQQQSESYSAAKGAINSLTHSLMMSFSNKIRVNCIAPGWIDTSYKVYEGPDALQHPSGRVGNPMDIANMVLYLCSDKASFINGQTIYIDGGMSKQMIYHNDYNWKLDK